jgi:hypothetical protein
MRKEQQRLVLMSTGAGPHLMLPEVVVVVQEHAAPACGCCCGGHPHPLATMILPRLNGLGQDTPDSDAATTGFKVTRR